MLLRKTPSPVDSFYWEWAFPCQHQHDAAPTVRIICEAPKTPSSTDEGPVLSEWIQVIVHAGQCAMQLPTSRNKNPVRHRKRMVARLVQ